jgi:hypothetical protein
MLLGGYPYVVKGAAGSFEGGWVVWHITKKRMGALKSPLDFLDI